MILLTLWYPSIKLNVNTHSYFTFIQIKKKEEVPVSAASRVHTLCLSFKASVTLAQGGTRHAASVCANYSPTVKVHCTPKPFPLLLLPVCRSPEQISLIAGKCLPSRGRGQRARITPRYAGQGQSRMGLMSSSVDLPERRFRTTNWSA